MPDHIHLLITPNPDFSISSLMRTWKSYTARMFDIHWQSDFFEHRLRSNESSSNKAYYMELNPVRAGLMKESKEWKWFGYLHPKDEIEN